MKRRDALWAAALALIVSTLYLVTLRPDVGGTEDSPKFQFLGQVLGTAHTPGYPFYTLATWLFTRVELGTLAYRVNLFSAVCGVWSILCIFWLARRLGVSRAPAAVAALAAATGFPVWSNAITAEVYTLSALMSTLTVLLLVAWIQEGTRWRLYAACAVFAAGLGNHLTIVGLLPAALIYGIARDRSVLQPRVIATAAVIGFLGVAQYGFIALRTIQGAPYLEARATSLLGIYHVIIAKDVSWARFYQEADKVVGIEVPMLLDGLRVHMGTVTVALVVLAILAGLRKRQPEVLLIAGGAAGTLAIVANLWGDVVGFITPVIVLLWPLAAWGFELVIRRWRDRDLVVNAAATLALALPIWNLIAIHPSIERLRQPGEGPAMRAMYSRLPDGAAVVAHNYWIARIFNYLDFSNEYDPDPTPQILAGDATQVRAAAAAGKPVFALDGALPWLTSQGLRFAPTALTDQPLDAWLAGQPDGTVVAMAAAGRPLPIDAVPAALGEHALRRSNFAVAVWAKGGAAPRLERGDDAVTLQHEMTDGPPLEVEAGDDGVRVRWGDTVIAAGDRGLAAVAVTPTGRIAWRRTLAEDGTFGVPLTPLAYVFRDEVPCAVLRLGERVDVSTVLADGAWLATVDGAGHTASIAIDGVGPPSRWDHRLTNGRGQAGIESADSRLSIENTLGTRAVFRFQTVPPAAAVTATLESGERAVLVCQAPAPPLPSSGALETGPESDGYFGPGWHTAEHAGEQRFRWASRQSSMLWRMDAPADVRLILRVRAAAPEGATITAAVNGTAVPACESTAGAWTDCRIKIPASATTAGLNQLTLTSNTVAPDRPNDPRELAFTIQASRVRVTVP